jgi:hypothetical protein
VAYLNPSDTMTIAAAQSFADARRMTGFSRFSFINYGRLAEEHRRIGAEGWRQMGEEAGLSGLRVETRAGGLIVFAAGTRQ